MSTINYKEKLEVSRNVRFTKNQMKSIFAYCKRNKVAFSDLARQLILKEVANEG